jgi:hypothetical protein
VIILANRAYDGVSRDSNAKKKRGKKEKKLKKKGRKTKDIKK